MKNSDFKILIINTDAEKIPGLEAALIKEGFFVALSDNSSEAVKIAAAEFPQLILINSQIPGSDGIETCIELRHKPELLTTLIIFYSDRDDEYSQINAFNEGADDYIIKPVRPRVLISRFKALLKRYSDHFIKTDMAGLTIDRERYLIFLEGKEIILPRKEFELLSLLSTSPGKVFTRKEISQLIWGYEIFSKNRTIDVHIRKLREKLGDKYIKTIKGIGYSLEV